MEGINSPIVSMFINDIKIIGVKKSGHIKKVNQELLVAFAMVDMGLISFYLRLKVKKNQAKKTLKLLQLAYINKILTKYHLDQVKPCDKIENTAIKQEPRNYVSQARAILGHEKPLMFSMIEIR